MHPKSFVGRAPPGPAAGAYSAPPDPLLILKKGRREMGKGGKGRGEEGKGGVGGEGRKGRGGARACHPYT